MRTALLLLVLLMAAPAAAQDGAPVPEGDVDVPPGENVVTPLLEGARAPYTGQLFDTSTALRWGNRIVRYRMRISLLTEELSLCRRESAESAATQLRISSESYEREIEGLRADLRAQAARYETELAHHRNPPFYETWGFAFGMGVLVMGAVVGIVGGLVVGL